jgi:uroporphyrinogen decarboxylase-like protein
MTDFDPERDRKRLDESRRRLSLARAFQEPDRVPITISTGGSFYCKLFGVNLRDYYQDAFGSLDLQLEVQLRGLQWAFEELQDDRTGYGVHLDIGPIQEALLFDLPVEYPDDTSPWAVRTLTVPEADEWLKLTEPEANPRVLEVYRQCERLKEKVEKLGLKVGVGGGLQIHPPLSAACGILDVEEVLVTLHDDPMLVHRLFQKLLLAFFERKEFHDRCFGTRTTSIGLAHDHSAFVSDAMYRQHVMPYNRLIYARYGQHDRHLHADGPNDHHFQTYADIVRLTSMDIGGFSDIANAKPIFAGKLFFSGGLNCKELYGDFAAARPSVDRALRIGMPGGGYALAVGGETYAGVNPDTLCQVVAYAKKAGAYPIRQEEIAV